MASSWSAEQVLALAPDRSSARSAEELAAAGKWGVPGTNDQLVWGECQGSGSRPYQTQIDLSEPAFKCSCPSRKIPCKHSLALFLLLVEKPGLFKTSEPPSWVSEWARKRAQRAEQRSKPRVEAAPDPVARDRRAAQREDRVLAGIADLELWLLDLVRQGLANAQSQPSSFWETPAARLVDSQAPGLARIVRQMSSIPASGEGWQGRLLEKASLLFLVVEAYRRLDAQSPATQHDLRSVVGYTQNQDDLRKQACLADSWVVAGQRIEEAQYAPGRRSPSLRTQRTWLCGRRSGRTALLLSFAPPREPFDIIMAVGTEVQAELVFFAGAYPMRALVRSQSGAPFACQPWAGYPDLRAATAAFAASVAANPWLEIFPMSLQAVTPAQDGGRWRLLDTGGRQLPVAAPFPDGWQLFAIAGGHPISVFGEWNGNAFWPLSAWAEDRLFTFSGQ